MDVQQPRLRGAIDAAQAAGVPVIYVVVGFRAGYPEVSPCNKGFGALSRAGDRPCGPGRCGAERRWHVNGSGR
jgi:hypothetical protein